MKETEDSPEWEVTVESIDLKIYVLVDIREEFEVEIDPLTTHSYLHLPLSQLDPASLDRETHYLFFCRRGRRSYALVDFLRKEGFDKVFSLSGGIDELR